MYLYYNYFRFENRHLTASVSLVYKSYRSRMYQFDKQSTGDNYLLTLQIVFDNS